MDAAEAKDRAAFDEALKGLWKTMTLVQTSMDTMWQFADPKSYDRFRTFIMGVKQQPMFPNGLIYEGVSEEPKFLRGETGANDSIVPTVDNVLEMTSCMPSNPLTRILQDFRKYRPPDQQQWLTYTEERAREAGVRSFALGNANSAVLYQANLDQLREFRDRHWRFTKEYIIRFTDHPVATGGSPIITWLPNQLKAVMDQMVAVKEHVDPSQLRPELSVLHDQLTRKAQQQERLLVKEVQELKKKFPGQDLED